MNIPVPKTISKYLIKGTLGQGAMGVVYLGFDPQIERHVAIKTIADDLTDIHKSKNQAERFVQEAKLLAKCNHPNIVSILDFGHQDKMAYMVMEYIKGKSLKEVLSKGRKLPLMTIMSVFVQLLKALNVAHSNNIIHRDLKPDNVLFANKTTLKVTDFGIAKSDESEMMTQIGVTVGTPKYMAPEQMFGTDELGPYTDLYSLFVILYEMFGCVSDQEQYEMAPLLTTSEFAKHNKFNVQTLIPTNMHQFITKGLNVSFRERFKSSTEVVKALKPILSLLKTSSNLNKESEAVDGDETTDFFNTGTVITRTNEDLIIEPELFSSMRDHLSDLMGPMADFILTDALKNSHNQDQFIMLIAEKLDNQKVRESFIDRWRTF